MKPDPELTVSEWADKHRMLSTKASAFPGPWDTKRTPYLREIMDSLSASSPIQQVVVMKGAQLGLSEAGNNWLGYVIHHVPGPMLYVMPTVETVKRVSKQRIATMIEDTPVIQERVHEPRSKDSGNTILSKEFPGGTLVMTGANSAVGLRSMPARYLFLDEVDGYPLDVDSEGDPINLAIKRTQTFSQKRKIFMISTPTIKGLSRIERAFEETDKRYYHVPCPHCGTKQTITWSKIRWHNNDPETAHCVCQHCDGEIEEHHKNTMLQKGEWVASVPEAKTVGFHLSGLYSPSEWYPWSKCVEEYLVAKEESALLKTWVNTALGETWDQPGTQVDSNMLYYRREEYKAEVPNEAIVITAGVDVQGDRLEAEAVGWNEQKESWSIDYQIFWGDPDQPDVWHQLEEWLTKEWKHETGHRLKIECACIDSGGHHTQQVYAFCKPRTRRRVFAIKGVGGMGRPIASSPSQKRTGREARPVPLFTIGVDTAKEVLYSRLLKTEQGAGYCHFPNHEPPYTEQFFEQLTAEKLVTKTAKGLPKQVWELTPGHRNEVLDCRVYAMAGLELLRPNFEKHREYLETEALTDHQREYEINRKKVMKRMNPKKRVVTSPWMADVLGGPGSFDY
ncbi:MAG: phage terminase large subunit family protein [Methylococcales bacterium]|nr:phage terminase large subunit family protein [Methylococcales bacterium]